MESEPDTGNGFSGKGAYFYESIQKALESTLVYSMLQKKRLLTNDQFEQDSSAGLDSNLFKKNNKNILLSKH